jgi:hypothetical protein
MQSHSSYARIEKVRADLYHFVVEDRFRHIDELIDDPKLLAMLSRESLVNENGEPISAVEIVNQLDYAAIGYVVTVSLVQRVA